MKKIFLKDIDEQSFFHFTNKRNLLSIEKNGLIPKIGQNAYGIEKTPKIFFVKGKLAILQLCDVWLKWMMNNTFNLKDLYGYYHNVSLDKRKKAIEEWCAEFLSKTYLQDEEKLKYVFNIAYEKMTKGIYLVLSLEENKHFKYNDIDEAKERVLKGKKENPIDYLYMKEMYGDFSNLDSLQMEPWNMHTISNTKINKECISQLISSNCKEDMLSIVKEIYKTYQDKVHFDILTLFMEYVDYLTLSRKMV